jgi:outer membrane protein
MEKTKKILGVVLVFWLIVAITPVYSEEGPKEKLFLKSGGVIECDMTWMPDKDNVGCKKGRGILLYSIDDVDLKKTFGEAIIAFPATTREEESRVIETIPSSISRQGIARKSAFGVRVSYMSYSGDEFSLYNVRVNAEADTTVAFGLNSTYYFNNHSSLEYSLDYVRTDVKFKALGYSFNMGELTQIPILLTLRLHPSTNATVRPYFGAGVGYYVNSFSTNSYNAALIYGAGAKFDVENSFGFHVNGGVEFFIAENYSFNVDLKYLLNKADCGVNISGYTREEMELNSVVVGVGLKYYF